MISKEQAINSSINTSSRFQQRSHSENNILKSTTLIERRLKKQISNKFVKKKTMDEVNISTLSTHRKGSTSFLISNPLAKSAFSMNDTITHKASLKQLKQPRQPRQPIKSVMSTHSKINSSYRQRYNSSMDDQLFKTRIASIQNREPTPILKPSQSARQITRYTASKISKVDIQARNDKFKLLFRQKNIKYKSASQRKISRIDTKIDILKNKKTYLQSLMPKQKTKIVIPKQKPRGEVIKKQKIMTLTLNLIKYLELYFNMYQHNNLVGGQFKNIEGYNLKIRNILMIDNNRAKRINNVQEITNQFWAFKEQTSRPEFFGQEDLALYNTLNGYLLKMEKKYSEIIVNYNYHQQKKKTKEKQAFRKTYQKFQKKFGKHEQISKINKFIENRIRYDQNPRQQYMQNLQKTGVKLNLVERSRQLILRQRQKALKNALGRKSIS